MKKKQMQYFFALISCLCFLTGCSYSETQTKTDEPKDQMQYEFDITGQTCDKGISLTDQDLYDKLINNTYYVVHDDILYPIYAGIDKTTNGAWDEDDAANYYDMYIFRSDLEKNIPTLFEGDRLVYYSKSNVLNYTMYYRMLDAGYSIGSVNLYKNISGRYFLNLDDSENILYNSGLDDIYNQKDIDYVMFDKVAGVQITDDLIDGGVIKGLEKDKYYDFELYLGTFFKPITLQSNFHIFRGFEKFASVEYETLQDFLYEIKIPEYLTTGYYYLNGTGMMRYVEGNVYNTDTDFNVPLLFLPEFDENGDPVDQSKYLYSQHPDLNKFSTSLEGCLGYVDPNTITDEFEDENQQPIVLSQTVTKNFDLWLLPGKVCQIKISSPSLEKTGKIKITVGDIMKDATYNYLDDCYILEINGRGERATLSVSGFKNDYKIQLTDCEQYSGQDEVQETQMQDDDKQSEGNGVLKMIKGVLDNVLHSNG